MDVKTIKIPSAKPKRLLKQAEVDPELWATFHKEMKKRDLKFVDVIEWALIAFIAQANPDAAKRFMARLR